MKTKTLTLLICAYAALPVFASAETSLSVFGIPLGRPLSLPPCTMTGGRAEPSSDGPCYKLNSTDTVLSTATRSAWVIFPFDKRPQIVAATADIGVGLIGGRVESVVFRTQGVASEQSDMLSLIDKFGKPSKITFQQWANSLGVQVRSANSVWTLTDGARVYFSSACGSIDNGCVEVDTKIGDAEGQADIKKMREKHSGAHVGL